MSTQRPIIVNQDKEKIRELSCLDPYNFQMKLASIRSFDDKIISILNTEIPTESFIGKSNEPSHKCKQLKQELHDLYDSRENSIKKCIDHYTAQIDDIKKSDISQKSLLREKAFDLRIFQQELDIEKIVRARTFKAVDERCRPFL